AARGVGQGLHRLAARPRSCGDRGDRRGAGRLDVACDRGGERDAVPAGRLLVRGREHPGQAPGVHLLSRRVRPVPGQVRRGGGGRLRGVRGVLILTGAVAHGAVTWYGLTSTVTVSSRR